MVVIATRLRLTGGEIQARIPVHELAREELADEEEEEQCAENGAYAPGGVAGGCVRVRL